MAADIYDLPYPQPLAGLTKLVDLKLVVDRIAGQQVGMLSGTLPDTSDAWSNIACHGTAWVHCICTHVHIFHGPCMRLYLLVPDDDFMK